MIINPPKFVVARDFKARGKVIDQVQLANWREHRLVVVWPNGTETCVPERMTSVLNRDVWIIDQPWSCSR